MRTVTTLMVLAAMSAGCGHLPLSRMPEELQHSGRLGGNLSAAALPGVGDPLLTIEGDGHTDISGAEPYAGGLLLGIAPSTDRAAVREIPIAIDPRLFGRVQECASFGCAAFEVGGMPHVFGIPVLGYWYGATANAGAVLTLGRRGPVGAHLRLDAMGAADRVGWVAKSWTALTFAPSASVGITGRAGGFVFGLDVMALRYLGSRAEDDSTTHLAESQLRVALSFGTDD